MTVNHLREHLRLPDFRTVLFGGPDRIDTGVEHLAEFRLDAGIPVWRYAVAGFELEKRVYFAYRHNTVHVRD